MLKQLKKTYQSSWIRQNPVTTNFNAASRVVDWTTWTFLMLSPKFIAYIWTVCCMYQPLLITRCQKQESSCFPTVGIVVFESLSMVFTSNRKWGNIEKTLVCLDCVDIRKPRVVRINRQPSYFYNSTAIFMRSLIILSNSFHAFTCDTSLTGELLWLQAKEWLLKC